MNNWKKIWNKRLISEQLNLESLIKADGFDSGAGKISVSHWREMINQISKKISLNEKDTIFEIGCGSGAFLYPFYINSHAVGGIDFSIPLIKMASVAMPGMKFVVDEAKNVNTDEKYDIVISNSVFQYFKDMDYANTVLERMMTKAKEKVVILDVNDCEKIEQANSIRQDKLGFEEYREKYKDLNHQFYSKKWFKDIAIDYNCKINIYNQAIDGYLNSVFRFNVIITKNN